jgi:hypothetical protein
MKRIIMVGGAVIAVAASGFAFSDGGSGKFSEFLTGLKEAPAIVSTTATGTFTATLNDDETEINYVLTFQDLQSDVRQAHIHIGYPQNAGNIVLWLCDSAAAPNPVSPFESTPLCVPSGVTDFRNGTVTGTLTAAEVVAQAANGIAAADWAEVVALVKGGYTYVNVHTASIGAGEIRSQIANGDDADGHHGNGPGGH